MFYAISMKPEFYQERINLFVALAPAVNIITPKKLLLKLMSKAGGYIENRLYKAGINEVFGSGWA